MLACVHKVCWCDGGNQWSLGGGVDVSHLFQSPVDSQKLQIHFSTQLILKEHLQKDIKCETLESAEIFAK